MGTKHFLLLTLLVLVQMGCATKETKVEEIQPAPEDTAVVAPPPDSVPPDEALTRTRADAQPPKESSQNLDQLTDSILQEAQTAVGKAQAEPVPAIAVPDVKPAPEKTPTPAKKLDRFYFVQIASFMKKQDAINLADSLRGGSVEPLIDVVDLRGQTWHRVIIGAFETSDEAKGYMSSEKIKDKFKDAFVRRAKKSELNLFRVE
jgi:cell division septation protein DedD